MVDIDRFKHLNDTFGPAFGDRVLVEVAARLQACVRQVDTVARLSGDVFVLLVHGAGARGAEGSARRLIEVMLRPFTLDGMSFTVTCSIGIALHGHDGASMDELVKNASAAMHRVKEAGRAGYRLHQPRQGDSDLRTRIRIDHAMRQGLERGDFRLHYQPQIDLHSGALVGAEALLRWTDATLGEVAPGDFIPVAEESGFIVRLGDWVLERAVRQAAAWSGRGLRVPVSVNVSALQFQQHGFVQRVAAVLRAARLPAERLELELTEVDPAGRCRRGAGPPARARRPGRAPGHRRLRHRLLEPRLPEALPDPAPEDRPQLRARPARRGERRRHRPLDHPARPGAEAAGGRPKASRPRRSAPSSPPPAATTTRASCIRRRCRATSSSAACAAEPGSIPRQRAGTEIATTMFAWADIRSWRAAAAQRKGGDDRGRWRARAQARRSRDLAGGGAAGRPAHRPRRCRASR